ncbi:MAG: hypothetical protein AAGF47_06210, partial [Planctomycetota bacterium]
RRVLDTRAERATAGDGPGYLTHIDHSEVEWSAEQTAWARDLARITPDLLRFELGSIETRELGRYADGQLRVTWNTPNWDGPDRVIELPVSFRRSDGGTWFYGGRRWNELDAEGLRVMYAEGLEGYAEAAVEFWPAVKAHVDKGFATELDHPQVIKLYDTMAELQFSIFPAYVEPLGGWNEPGESIKLVAGEYGPDYFRSTIAHEYAHALTFAMGPDDLTEQIEHAHNLPWWVAEGTAELAALEFSGSWGRVRRAVRAWHAEGQLISWDRITDFYTTDPADYRYVYVMGCHMVGYLSERFGRQARNAWLAAMMNGSTLDGACREAFGVGFEQLDAEWRASIDGG